MDARTTITEKFREHHGKKAKLYAQLVEVARSAAPLLKDLGHGSSARRIDEILFQLDALEEELSQTILADPEAAMDAVLKGLRDR